MSETLSEVLMIRIDPKTKKQLELRATLEDRTMSNMARVAISTYLGLCPMCDGPTFVKDGVRYCEHCNAAVSPVTE